MTDHTLLPWQAVMRSYRELLAYGIGERDVILIDNEYTNSFNYEASRTWNKYSVIIFRHASQAEAYDQLLAEHHKTYAIGVALGYPPAVVKWFAQAPVSDRVTAQGVHFRSWDFACPSYLLAEAKAFYKQQFQYSDEVMNNAMRIVINN